MEKKSESWCSWVVSGIKSLFCPRQCGQIFQKSVKKRKRW